MLDKRYNRTVAACFVGLVVQAVVNNFVPLLFLTFQRSYGIPLGQITLLVTLNFGLQLLVDLLSVTFVDRIGYRAAMVLAHLCAALGLGLMAVLPELLPDPFVGILIAVLLYAAGGGLLEVVVSPVVEACPSENKEKAMSMLHSFYCWGYAGVVLLSTLFFALFGIQRWRILALLWALLPIGNALVFLRVPIAPLIREGERGYSLRELLKKNLFWLLFLMMICSGAAEQAVGQWASAFAEKGLGISKAAGDLAGPMAFALMQGTSRAWYGRRGERVRLGRFMALSCALCVLCYLGIALLRHPVLSLLLCALCGFSVGIFWPGTYSRASAALPRGGTAMFALLALAGDMGCALGPSVAGAVSAAAGEDLKRGILAAVVFPVLLLLGVLLLNRRERQRP